MASVSFGNCTKLGIRKRKALRSKRERKAGQVRMAAGLPRFNSQSIRKPLEQAQLSLIRNYLVFGMPLHR